MSAKQLTLISIKKATMQAVILTEKISYSFGIFYISNC